MVLYLLYDVDLECWKISKLLADLLKLIGETDLQEWVLFKIVITIGQRLETVDGPQTPVRPEDRGCSLGFISG